MLRTKPNTVLRNQNQNRCIRTLKRTENTDYRLEFGTTVYSRLQQPAAFVTFFGSLPKISYDVLKFITQIVINIKYLFYVFNS